ncbi:MAG: ATP-binding protein [Dehalococcoidia bacterium]|nr:ATP-binding protein [Dehalococcoidia bacterium]
MDQRQALRDTDHLIAGLGILPDPLARPVLIVVSGLPGTGKSFFSRSLARQFPLVILETDLLRQRLVARPTHSTEESQRLFAVVHLVIERLLRGGAPVLLDATNLVERHREILYHLAEQTGAKLILVQTRAPREVAMQRLRARAEQPAPQDHSTAGVEVYQRMRLVAEPIRRRHYVVDTSKDISPTVARVVRAISGG